MSYLDLNAEISFPVRIQILMELSFKEHKLNELAEKFPLSKSEISRHLSRLIEVEFVTKDPSTNQYILTTLAENYIAIFSPLEFLFKNKRFFSKHKLELPAYLSRRIDALSNAKLIIGSGVALTTIQSLLDQTVESIKLLLNQRYPMKLQNVINEGTYIIDKKMVESGQEYVQKMYKKVYIKTNEVINHLVMICDNNRGVIAFQSNDLTMDLNEMFLVDDKEGVSYINDIFEYYWKNSNFL